MPEQKGSQGAANEIAGRFRLLDSLGQGGMGRVFLAEDGPGGPQVAVKLMARDDREDQDLHERYRRESAALAGIRHRAVPRVLGWGAHDGRSFLVTEFIDGETLKVRLQREGPWDPRRTAALGIVLAEALEAAHRSNVIHRDVKPSNVMLSKRGQIFLLDFGLARPLASDISNLTRTGVVVGTPGYMSPEQFAGSPVDALTDIYSLGVLLYQVLTGVLPFDGATPVVVAMKQKCETPLSIRELRPEVPSWLDRLVLRCMAHERFERPQSAKALAEALSHPDAEGRSILRKLPTGDSILEDQDDSARWPLILYSDLERSEWNPGLGVQFGPRILRFESRASGDSRGYRWAFRFAEFAQCEVFRGVVTYEEDTDRSMKAQAAASSKTRRWRPFR